MRRVPSASVFPAGSRGGHQGGPIIRGVREKKKVKSWSRMARSCRSLSRFL